MLDETTVKLRQTLGILGILLPILNLFFGLTFCAGYNPAGSLTSISATYYSGQSIIFTGLMFGVGLFFLCYKGYDIKDRICSILTGIAAFVLVLFPCDLPGATNRNFLMLPMEVTKYFHYIGALVFFLSLAYIILFQFTKTSEINLNRKSRKWKRNILYRVCGIIMLAGLILGFTARLWSQWPYWVFTGETIALWNFGIAWLCKGDLILKDL